MDFKAHTDLLEQLRAQRQDADNDVFLLCDGVVVCGHAISLTMGGLAVLQHVRNPFVCRSERKADVLAACEVLFVCAEDTMDIAVSTAADKELFAAQATKFARGYSRKKQREIMQSIGNYMQAVNECLPELKTGDDYNRHDPRWWTALVDMLASEYKWPEEYIVWGLPYVRVIEYRDRIIERVTRRPRIYGNDNAAECVLDELRRRMEAEQSKGLSNG